METLPVYIPIGFAATTLLTVFLLYKASGNNRLVLGVSMLWLVLQGLITLTGFYQVSSGVPPRFVLLLFPPLILTAVVFSTKRGRSFLDTFDLKMLTLLHAVRIPVELTLFGLYLHHWVPQLITFEGGNLDILSGLTALFIWRAGRKWQIAWNIACLLLLANIVVRAILSAPFAFQQFGFEQPNIALFHFPFSWLPGFVVPLVLFAHLTSLRKLLKNK
jgi:hypothetical protein